VHIKEEAFSTLVSEGTHICHTCCFARIPRTQLEAGLFETLITDKCHLTCGNCSMKIFHVVTCTRECDAINSEGIEAFLCDKINNFDSGRGILQEVKSA
jgi:hypothetical protein